MLLIILRINFYSLLGNGGGGKYGGSRNKNLLEMKLETKENATKNEKQSFFFSFVFFHIRLIEGIYIHILTCLHCISSKF
jgi:hypothetical protein